MAYVTHWILVTVAAVRFDYVEASLDINVQRLHDTLRDCVRHPSPQPDMAAVRRFILEVVKPRLAKLPFDKLAVDEMGNLVATLRGHSQSSPFLFCTYAGTCPPGEMPDPLEPRILEGDAVGRPRQG